MQQFKKIIVAVVIAAGLITAMLPLQLQQLVAQSSVPTQQPNKNEEAKITSLPLPWPSEESLAIKREFYKQAITDNPIALHYDKIIFKLTPKIPPTQGTESTTQAETQPGLLPIIPVNTPLDIKVRDDPTQAANLVEKVRQALINNIRIDDQFYYIKPEMLKQYNIDIGQVEYSTLLKDKCNRKSTITYGVPDNFNNANMEPTFKFTLFPWPYWEFGNDTNGQISNHGFDENLVNYTFIHDIVLPECLLKSATLEIKVRANYDIPKNDGLMLIAMDNTGNICDKWHANFTKGWAGPGADYDGLELIGTGSNHDGIWSSGEVMTLNLDLGNLPLSSGGSRSLIPALNYCSGYLHIVVLDDTAVDYVKISFN